MRCLDWIEKVQNRIKNISSSWGHLAASSKFDWERAIKWLDNGRPLSLISIDALIYCTSNGERQNQSLWMRKVNPNLINSPNPEVISNRLKEYLLIDSVPRTKTSVHRIMENILEENKT